MTEHFQALLESLSAELKEMDSGWSDYFNGLRFSYLEHLKELSRFPPHGITLEVGGFPFNFSFCLKKLGYDPVVLDLAPERMQPFISKHDLNVIQVDVEQEGLPLRDGSVNLIVFTDTFEHLRIDPIFVLEEMARVLAPDGTLYLTTPNFYRLGNIARILLGKGPMNHPLNEYLKLRRAGHMGHVREYTAKELESLLKFAGFTDLCVQYSSPGRSSRGAVVDLLHRILIPMRPQLVVMAKKS
ncbi:class I SAM-dependent methyltransferase [Mariprofundus sp. KV]|uniref:methyltransferase domain-containing protein n=1 Tax=Mariprofundus sp. KV TaxID=2608715 RepID=UPI0015A2567D